MRSFNSRTPEGCDNVNHIATYCVYGFNSRTPEGCDFNFAVELKNKTMFQFTHP